MGQFHHLPPGELSALLRLWGRLQLLEAIGVDTAAVAAPVTRRLQSAGVDLGVGLDEDVAGAETAEAIALAAAEIEAEAAAQAAAEAEKLAQLEACETMLAELEATATTEMIEAEGALREALIEIGVDPQVAMNPPMVPAMALPEPVLAAIAAGDAAALATAVEAMAVEQAISAEAALREALIEVGVDPALMDAVPELPADSLPDLPTDPAELMDAVAARAEAQLLDAQKQLKLAMAELGVPLPPGPLII